MVFLNTFLNTFLNAATALILFLAFAATLITVLVALPKAAVDFFRNMSELKGWTVGVLFAILFIAAMAASWKTI